jgi:hypothetical protein
MFGTILVCAMEVVSCDPSTAYRAIHIPAVFPNKTVCHIALMQIAATDVVPVGRLMLVCSHGPIKLDGLPT